jgi:hypothetical protein
MSGCPGLRREWEGNGLDCGSEVEHWPSIHGGPKFDPPALQIRRGRKERQIEKSRLVLLTSKDLPGSSAIRAGNFWGDVPLAGMFTLGLGPPLLELEECLYLQPLGRQKLGGSTEVPKNPKMTVSMLPASFSIHPRKCNYSALTITQGGS